MREEKEGGRKKNPAEALSRAILAHAPHHCDGGGEAHQMVPRKVVFGVV
jgi:hypothetical protein